MASTLEDAAWGGSPEALEIARAEAASILLSGHITQLSNLRSGAVGKKGASKLLAMLESLVFGELAARRLMRRFIELDHNDLSRITSWQIQVAKRLPWRVHTAQEIARVALRKAINVKAPPYDIALAYAVKAQALGLSGKRITRVDRDDLICCIQDALSYEDRIRALPEPLLGLRQHVRVLKLAGETLMELGGDHHREARKLWLRALALAEGDADAKSQTAQLRQLIKGP